MAGLHWLEYAVFVATLVGSLLVGLFLAFTDKDKHTTSAYLFGGGNMGVIPVTMSLISSHISGVTLIGVPTEIYKYGTQYLISNLGYIVVLLLTIYVFLPVFYNLKMVSLYEYLEMRYNKKIRRLVSLVFAFHMTMATPLTAYAPAIVFNQVSGANILLAAAILTGVCVLYTIVGGLKAVVWTDTLQGVLMLGSTCTVIVLGTWKAEGLSQILKAAEAGDRIEFFRMDPDPRVRASFWSCFFGVTTAFSYLNGVHPAFVQRYQALPTIAKAKKAAVYFNLGCIVFASLSGLLGLVIYKEYKDCDPISSGLIERDDQIVSYFLVDVGRKLPGLTGIFLGGIVSSALSTISTNLNTLSGTFYADVVEPLIGKGSDAKATWTMRFLVLIFGIISLLILLIMDKLAAILELAHMALGLASGSIFGIFLLGLFFPQSNSFGCFGGALCGLVTLTWVMVGARLAVSHGAIHSPGKPVSVAECMHNFTTSTKPTMIQDEIFPLFEMSLFYYTTLGSLITVVMGLLLSYLTGGQKGRTVEPNLLSSFVRPRDKRRYAFLPLKRHSNNVQS